MLSGRDGSRTTAEPSETSGGSATLTGAGLLFPSPKVDMRPRDKNSWENVEQSKNICHEHWHVENKPTEEHLL